MQNDIVKQWAELSNNALASFKNLGEINAKTLEKLTHQNLEFVSSCMEASVKQANLLSESKGYQDLLSGQASLAAEYNELVIDALRKATDTVTESKDEITAWFEKEIEHFTPPSWPVSAPSKSTTKKAA